MVPLCMCTFSNGRVQSGSPTPWDHLQGSPIWPVPEYMDRYSQGRFQVPRVCIGGPQVTATQHLDHSMLVESSDTFSQILLAIGIKVNSCCDRDSCSRAMSISSDQHWSILCRESPRRFEGCEAHTVSTDHTI